MVSCKLVAANITTFVEWRGHFPLPEVPKGTVNYCLGVCKFTLLSCLRLTFTSALLFPLFVVIFEREMYFVVVLFILIFACVFVISVPKPQIQ